MGLSLRLKNDNIMTYFNSILYKARSSKCVNQPWYRVIDVKMSNMDAEASS